LKRLNKTGCELNHQRLTPDRDRKTSDRWILRRRGTGRRATIGEQESETKSGGDTFVAGMQADDLWDGDHVSDPAWHDRAGIGAILFERKMRAGALVVVDVRGQDAAQMATR
jgi:hypothetical protein